MAKEMTQLIAVLVLIAVTGLLIYIIRFKGKEKPIAGIKRENLKEYSKDYWNLKLYWTSIMFMIVGTVSLVAILILEIIF